MKAWQLGTACSSDTGSNKALVFAKCFDFSGILEEGYYAAAYQYSLTWNRE